MLRIISICTLLILPASASACSAKECTSADGKYRVWVKDTPNMMVGTGGGDNPATELWIQEMPAGKSWLLVSGHEDPDIKKTIAVIHDPCFSIDQKQVYFSSAAWATSNSVQCVDLRTGKTRFIIEGSVIELIARGKHKGCLLVTRDLIKLDKNGESLGRASYLWLVKADGTPVREIGVYSEKTTEEFKKHL